MSRSGPSSNFSAAHSASGGRCYRAKSSTIQPVVLRTMNHRPDREIATDVLVVGGGLAGCWAALRACQSGARTLLVDKGYVSRAGCSPLSGGVMTAPLPSDDLDAW